MPKPKIANIEINDMQMGSELYDIMLARANKKAEGLLPSANDRAVAWVTSVGHIKFSLACGTLVFSDIEMPEAVIDRTLGDIRGRVVPFVGTQNDVLKKVDDEIEVTLIWSSLRPDVTEQITNRLDAYRKMVVDLTRRLEQR